MDQDYNVVLTSAELANLWNTYLNDSMAVCMMTFFLSKAKDPEIKEIVLKAYQISNQHIKDITAIYRRENHPIPQGFGDKDVNVDAPPLFLDSLYLHYIKQMSRIGLAAYSFGLSLAVRPDTREFFMEALRQAAELDQEVTRVLLSKGLYIRAPYIPSPDKIEFVQKKNFINGILKPEHRPLLAIEITHLYANIQTNALGKALLMGFSQVAQSQEVREYMKRGRDIASKHIKVLGNFLEESHLKTPMTWNDTVSDSTISPFSDKLMMFHTTTITAIGLADYGASISITLRKDLTLSYTRLAGEIGPFAEDGGLIMIKNSWMEQPPQAPDRDALTK